MEPIQIPTYPIPAEAEKIVCFTVPGEPTGKGRPKFDTRGKYPRAITPRKTETYESYVRAAYAQQCNNYFFPRESALAFVAIAYKPIPKSASKRRVELMRLNRIMPGKKPDWDNVGKIVCDALNGVAFHDDAQIVDGRTIKRYADVPRVEVVIVEVGENG